MISKKDNLVIFSLLIFIDTLFFIVAIYFNFSKIFSMRYLILSILYICVCYFTWLIIKDKINENMSESKPELDIERTSSLENSYLFSWAEIPGNDNVRLTDFIKSNYDVDWVKTANISKIDNDKTIMITAGNNIISLNLNNVNTELNLKIDNGKTDKFIVKTENGKLYIYENPNKQEQSLSLCYTQTLKNPFEILKESLIIIIGNLVAFSFAIFYSSNYDSKVVTFISEAVRIEVLLLAIGVPLVFNTILNKQEHDHDKNPVAVELLQKYIQLSLIIILLLLFQLALFNKDSVSIPRFHEYLGFLEIDDNTMISISLFLFIISLFFFCYILFNLINTYLIRRITKKSIELLRNAIRTNNEETMRKHLGMFNDTCIIGIMNDMIRAESKNANESWLNGIFFVLQKYHKIYKKSKNDDIKKNAMQLLYDRNNNVKSDNKETIKKFIENNYPNIKKVTI